MLENLSMLQPLCLFQELNWCTLLIAVTCMVRCFVGRGYVKATISVSQFSCAGNICCRNNICCSAFDMHLSYHALWFVDGCMSCNASTWLACFFYVISLYFKAISFKITTSFIASEVNSYISWSVAIKSYIMHRPGQSVLRKYLGKTAICLMG